RSAVRPGGAAAGDEPAPGLFAGADAQATSAAPRRTAPPTALPSHIVIRRIPTSRRSRRTAPPTALPSHRQTPTSTPPDHVREERPSPREPSLALGSERIHGPTTRRLMRRSVVRRRPARQKRASRRRAHSTRAARRGHGGRANGAPPERERATPAPARAWPAPPRPPGS